MQSTSTETAPERPTDEIEVDLKNAGLAALLAWLLPGAGHFYQKRWAKGLLFFTCIMGTFFYGLYLGGGKVVYYSMRPGDNRLSFICQVGTGAVTFPALLQAYRMNRPVPQSPLFGGFMAPPRQIGQVVPEGSIPEDRAGATNKRGFVVNHVDELGEWNDRLGAYFELGTVFTMIAGLLNVLAIYDAWGGPLFPLPHPKKQGDDKGKGEEDKK